MLDIEALLNRWVYDVRGLLVSQLESLRDDLRSDDAETRAAAQSQVDKVLDWLYLPTIANGKDAGDAGDAEHIEQALIAAGVPPAQRKAMLAASRVTGRKVGRPRTAKLNAVEAFRLHLQTGKTWRQIVFDLKGACKHRCKKCGDVPRRRVDIGRLDIRRTIRPLCPRCGLPLRAASMRHAVCFLCADALRAAVGELEVYLRSHDLYPTMPRRVKLPPLVSAATPLTMEENLKALDRVRAKLNKKFEQRSPKDHLPVEKIPR